MKFIIKLLFFFTSVQLSLYASNVELLTDLKSHRTFLKSAIQKATGNDAVEVIIVSPYITASAIKHDNLESLLYDAKHHLCVYGSDIDPNLDNENDGRKILMSCFVDYKLVHNVHTKCIIIGNEKLAIGSFNWLSSTRWNAPGRDYILEEATTVISD